MIQQRRSILAKLKQATGITTGLLTLLLLITSLQAFGQATTGDIVGSVSDSTGASIPGATIVITDVDTGTSRNGVSTDAGDFVFPLLQTGTYKVVVTAPSFKQFDENAITLTAGARVRVDAKLEAGSAGESVTVSGDTTPSMQTDSSTVQSSVTEKAVQDLPLNGRNFIGLVQLAPGVNAGNPSGIPAGGAPDDRRQSSSVVANGQSYLQNNQLIDGLDNNEREQGVIGVRPSIDAIAEVRIITSNYPAEVGRASGAVVNVITKAGSNQFHGSAYEFFRNDIFDTRNFFTRTGDKPELRQNQFGGSVGGPIIKNKTFFFGALEYLREVTGSTYTDTVPTLFEEQNPGNFSDINGPIVPTADLSPVSLNYFKLYPAPNQTAQSIAADGTPLGNFSFSPSRTFNSVTVDARVDHHFNDNNTLFVHYGYNPVNVNSPGQLPTANEFGKTIASGGVGSFGQVFGAINGLSQIRAQGIAIDYLHIVSPKLVLELKTGFTRVNIQSTPLDYGTNLGDQFGVVNSNLGTADTSGLASILFFAGPYASLGDGYFVPILNRNNNYQYNGTVTYTSGAHSIKAGGALVRRQLNYFQDQFSPQGGFAFFPTATYPNSMAAFLAGQAAFAQRGNLLVHPGYRLWEPSAFVQDDWRAASNLTINLGLRYEIFTPFTEAHNQYSNFNLSALQVQVAGVNTSSTLGIKTQYKNFSPRVGFAMSLPHNTVVRGGFGMGFFPVDFQNVIQNDNPPFSFVCFPCFSTQYPVLPLPSAASISNPAGQLTTKSPNFGPGYNESYNLTVQRQFGANVLTASYVGLVGRKLLYEGDADRPLPPGANQPANGYVYATQLPNVDSIAHNFNGAVSNYNSLQLAFDRHYTNGLTFAANYTLAHGMIDGSPTGTSQDPTGLVTGDPSYDYGNSNLDIRHRVTTTANYQLPFGKSSTGLKALAVKDWQVNVLAFWQSGLPFTVVDSETQGPTDPSPGLAYIGLPGVTEDRPNVVGSEHVSNPGINGWFNTSAFVPQTPGTPGDVRRNAYYGPHDRRADLSLFKDLPLYEAVKLQFRAECFNISNTPNFDRPASILGGAGFGKITDTVPGENPRQFQFALKMQF